MKIGKFVLVLMIILALNTTTAFAATKAKKPVTSTAVTTTAIVQTPASTTGWIQITAAVPDGFDRSITVNLFCDNGYNALFTVNKINGFTLKQPVTVGKYKLDFISVFGDAKKEFKVDAPNELEIKGNELTTYNLSVSGNVTQAVENTPNQSGQNIFEKATQTSVTTNPPNIMPTPAMLKNTNFNQYKVGNSYMFTIALAIVLIIIVLIMKYRKMRDKDE